MTAADAGPTSDKTETVRELTGSVGNMLRHRDSHGPQASEGAGALDGALEHL